MTRIDTPPTRRISTRAHSPRAVREHTAAGPGRLARRRLATTVVISAGTLVLAWTLAAWRVHEPVTALYTRAQQAALSVEYDRESAARLRQLWRPEDPRRPPLSVIAARYRSSLLRGEAIGRLAIPRLGLDLVVVNGTDDATLRKGPGRDPRGSVPGEGRLVYLAGHRTTYLAPFGQIDVLEPGDRITFALPYATFVYSVTRHVVVAPTYLSVLRSRGRETLALQTCHPRFLARERYVVYAEMTRVVPASPVRARSGEPVRRR
jgi:sortase A